MNRINKGYFSIEQVQDLYLKKQSELTQSSASDEKSFAEILNQKENTVSSGGTLKFSKHAANRLTERNITLSEEQMNRLLEGTGKAFEKGIKESLVLIDDLAFIVSTGNQTVITAMDQSSSEENIYTNIDGAVIN